MEENREYSEITLELLERISFIKKAVMSSMTVGDTEILKGIDIFEEILKNINPFCIDDKTYSCFDNVIGKYVINKNGLNNYNYCGISRCMMMLYNYILNKSKEKVKKLK